MKLPFKILPSTQAFRASFFINIIALIFYFIVIGSFSINDLGYFILTYFTASIVLENFLNSYKTRLDEINILKDQENYRREFLGNVSHELKTPLFTIQGYILTLIEGALKDKKVRGKYLRRSAKGVDRLISIVKDLDLITQFESGIKTVDKTNFNICTYMSADLYLNGEEVSTGVEPFSKGFKLGYKAEIELVKGDKLTLTKYGGYTVSLNHPEEELEQVAMEKINYARARGFQGLLKEQEEVWHAIWKMSDIVIKGDLSAQQGIRFNIFQLNQTYTGSDSRLNIGPKGFTGEKYGGSAYWDTEAYCLPFFMVTKNANVAKNLLKYRYNQLPKAIENAEKLGFNNGAALFPMVTMNGEECHNEWEITFEEIHRNGAIAYAIYNYVRFTNDQTYIPEMGFEVLLAIARFWKQRVNYSSQKEKYVILGVTGPNEYENNVDNNWYTNYIAHWCLRYAAEQYNIIKAQHPKEFEEIFIKTNITDQEVMEWLTIAKNMYLPFSEKHQVYLQQDGFLDKELTTVDELNPNHRPINQHWSWDRILRSPFIKQADTLQGFYFFEDDFTIEELERHYDFYTPFTLHESSLSPCVHSILATKLDKMNDAYDLYLRTSRLDLDDYNKEVEEGLHITSMSGTWMSIVYGFGGLKIVDDLLSIEPKLPKQWEGISFKINFRGELLKIDYYKENCVFEWSGEKPLKMLLRNQPITVNPSSKVNIAI